MTTDRSNEMTTFASQFAVRLGAAVFTLLVLGGASAAMAQEVPARGPIPFSVFDQNGDGVITEEEFRVIREKRRAARAAAGQPMRGLAFARSFTDFDADGDGTLTTEELAAGQHEIVRQMCGMGMGQGRGGDQGMGRGRNRPTFEEIDRDSSGFIAEDELLEFRNERIQERAAQGYRMKNLGNAPGFADIDRDGDGKISREEFAAHQSECREFGAR